MLRIKLVKSPIGNTARNRATVTALGLRKMQQTVHQPDNPAIRGMIHKVKHMLAVDEVPDDSAPTKAKASPARKASPKKPVAASAAEAKPKKAPAAKKAAETKPAKTAKAKKSEEK